MDSTGEDLRERASAAVAHLRTAAEAMITRLEFDIRFSTSVQQSLAADGPLAARMRELDTPAARQGLTDAINRLEAARLDARRQLFRVMIAEGHSIGEIARTWGISRQLASRILRD